MKPAPARASKKILIANRGRSRFRIIRACREMDITFGGGLLESDAAALPSGWPMRLRIGPAPSRDSYLNVDRVLAAAARRRGRCRASGVRVPGRKRGFAKASRTGLVFVGPRSETIALMGERVGAKLESSKPAFPCPGTMAAVATRHAAPRGERLGYR